MKISCRKRSLIPKKLHIPNGSFITLGSGTDKVPSWVVICISEVPHKFSDAFFEALPQAYCFNPGLVILPSPPLTPNVIFS